SHFQGITDYPVMQHGDIDEPDLASFSKFITDLVGAGILTPDEELEKHARRVGKLPEKVETGDNYTDKPADDETAKEEAATMYKIQSALDKYVSGKFPRDLTKKMLLKVGVTDEEAENYIADIDRNKSIQEADQKKEEAAAVREGNKDEEESAKAKKALGR
ncbi:MAG: hypothetical protein ACI4EF_03535, partial [Coprococcus sp.]